MNELNYYVINPDKYIDTDVIYHSDEIAKYTLTQGVLRAELYSSEIDRVSAIRTTLPTVKAWEFEAAIFHGHKWISFSSNETLIIKYRYPKAPKIAVSEIMLVIWERYINAKYGVGESLTSASYFAYTAIIGEFGSPKQTSKIIGVHSKVLKKLSELSSTRGDFYTARKKQAVSTDLSREEKHWIDMALRNILMQMGLAKLGSQINMITLQDLPSLA